MKAADLAIDMFREDGDRRGECRVWEGLSEIHMTTSDFSSSLRAAKRAETLCEEVGDTRLMARMKLGGPTKRSSKLRDFYISNGLWTVLLGFLDGFGWLCYRFQWISRDFPAI